MVYLWRAVGQEVEILESYVTKTRDKAVSLRFKRKAFNRHRLPKTILADDPRFDRDAMVELEGEDKREVGRWANNRAVNSHLPFRRRQRAMLRFR